jgi:hypothetical protein
VPDALKIPGTRTFYSVRRSQPALFFINCSLTTGRNFLFEKTDFFTHKIMPSLHALPCITFAQPFAGIISFKSTAYQKPGVFFVMSFPIQIS